MSRPLSVLFLVLLFGLLGCEEPREVREWTAEDHPQPQAGAADSRTAPGPSDAPTDEASAVATLFRLRCASCHGETGRGDGVGIPPGAQVRDLTSPDWQASVDDAAIAAVIAGGRGMMPRFDDSINQRGIDGLVRHIRGLAAE